LETSERRTHDGLWIGSFKGGLTFFLVIWGWILFRSPSLADAGWIMRQIIIDVWRWDMWWALSGSVPGKWNTLVTVIGMVILEGINRHRWNPLPLPATRCLRWLLYTGLFWWIVYFGTEQSSEFIYFQF
jgi:hypothetical protein